MKQVWKCDFCYHIDESSEKMKDHELGCSSNPVFKKCFSCEHQKDVGWEYPIPACAINLDVIEGEEDGNCGGWVEG